ncbi:unnamed protein product [Didymodactylos carnosus]|nr:unnamed protein product [Didymodactylos carnosus]CAF3690305.1 unnamed protein product [Didymodactylos carnosus]
MPLAKDLLHPTIDEERRKHKLKRLVQSPNSYFMDVKCPGCYKITTVFSHAQTVVLCVGCNYVLCSPSGGKARLTEGCSFRKKRDTPMARKDDADHIKQMRSNERMYIVVVIQYKKIFLMDIQQARQLDYLNRSAQLFISQPPDVSEQLEKLIDEIYSGNKQTIDKKKLIDSFSSEKEKNESTTSDNSSDSSTNSQISNKNVKQQLKRISPLYNAIMKPAKKRLKTSDNNHLESTSVIVDKKSVYTDETSEDERGSESPDSLLTTESTTSTNTTLKDEHAITNSNNNRNIDEFAIEMGLVCNLCMVLTEEVDNKLVECHECHNKFHQKCHKPNVSTDQISDPRCLWYCAKCRRLLLKRQQQQTNKEGKNSTQSKLSSSKDPTASKIKSESTTTKKVLNDASQLFNFKPKSSDTNSTSNSQSLNNGNGNPLSSSSVSGWAGLAANLKEKKQSPDSDSMGSVFTNSSQVTTPTSSTPSSSSSSSSNNLSDSTTNNLKDSLSVTNTNNKRSLSNETVGQIKSPTTPSSLKLSNIINPLAKIATTPLPVQLLRTSSMNHSSPKNTALKSQLSIPLDGNLTVTKSSSLSKVTSNNISKQIKRLSSPTPLGRASLQNSNIRSPIIQCTTLNNNSYSRMNSTGTSSTTTQKEITASTVAKIQNSYNCDKRLKQMKKLAQESRLKK